jgi:hypothetical protein
MTTVPTTEAFIPEQATGGAEQLPDLSGLGLPTEPFTGTKPLPGWATFTADDVTLAVFVHPATPWYSVERALAYGLFHAVDHERLVLILPEPVDQAHDPVQATRIRAAFLTRPVEVVSYAGADATPWPMMKADDAFAVLREPSIGDDGWELTDADSARVETLAAWADQQTGLSRVHLKHYLAWQCAGRQLLKIRPGKQATLVTAGVDYSKPDATAHQQFALELSLDAPMTPEQLANVQVRVLQGMLDRVCTFDDSPADNTHAEHRLQAAMVESAPLLGWNDARLPRREFPVRRPGGGRGYIDLLRLDPEGVLHIIETKIGHDEMLVLQGLDYWIWAQANVRALGVEMHGTIADMIIDFVVSLPDGSGHKAIDTLIGSYAYQHLSVLRPDIRRDVQVIEGWQPQPLTLTMRVPENAGE